MRNFLFILGLTITFFSQAQEMVVIKPETARYFLKADDELRVRRKRNLLDSTYISNQQTEIKLKNKVIQTYKEDSVVYNNQIDNDSAEIELTKKQLRKQNRKLDITIGAGTGAIIGSVIPGLGTLPGALIGGAAGLIRTLFRKH